MEVHKILPVRHTVDKTNQHQHIMSSKLFFLYLFLHSMTTAYSQPISPSPAEDGGVALTCDDLPGPKPTCKNKGKCKVGAKNNTEVAHIYPTIPNAPFWANTTYNDMYCACKDEFDPDILPGDNGFTGLFCEVFYMVCPDWSVCLHGSYCTENHTKPGHYFCDCEYSYTAANWYAGKSCEYPGTEFCGVEIDDKGEYDLAWLWFCANDGICDQRQADENKRCTCPENGGFHGPHCEFQDLTMMNTRIDLAPSENSLYKTDSMGNIIGFGLLAFVVLGVFLYLRRRGNATLYAPVTPGQYSDIEPFSDVSIRDDNDDVNDDEEKELM